ncbi:MAG: hypothetical protein Q8O38_09965 [Sulfurimicrobium sp.]|nr:hypothetical protein [Sulfurimicrobium sp.]
MIGHAVLFFVAGFVQFNYAINKGPGSAMLFLAALGAGVYFLGGWALLTFTLGAMVGGRLAIEQFKKDAAENAEIQQFTRSTVDD